MKATAEEMFIKVNAYYSKKIEAYESFFFQLNIQVSENAKAF